MLPGWFQGFWNSSMWARGFYGRKKKSTNSAGTVASISSVGGAQFDFQGSIRHCPAAMAYGIRISASTSFFPPLLAVLILALSTLS